jgi:3-oxoacyl-[acyl-carrier protein] reductase
MWVLSIRFNRQEDIMADEIQNPTPTGERVSRRTMLAAAMLASPGLVAVATGGANAQSSGANGKVALVTGSSRGIGAAIAKRLARDGFRVTVNCVVNRNLAAGVVREIEAAGGTAIWEQADVSDPVAVRRLFDANDRAFGGIDVVVNNAGVMRLARFRDMTDEDFARQLDVNVKGGFYVLREAARRVRDGGRIVSTSSSITELRTATYGPYAATKASLQIFSSVLAKELGGRMISVNAIAPGVVATPLFLDVPGRTQQEVDMFAQRTPHRRIGATDDIASVVSTLVGPDAGWVNGQTVFANGGLI